MRLVRWSRLRSAAALTPVILAAAVTPAAAAAGPAASLPGWHIAKTFASGSTIFSVAADGSHDAWLAGSAATGGLLVQHWNGSTWQAVSTPGGIPSVGGAVIAASSATDAWAFADVSASSDYSVALRRAGNGWVAYRFANWSNINAAAVFSRTDAWAFGGLFASASGPFVRHFNGKRWSGVATPIEPNDASAVSANDIWAVGQTAKSLRSAHQVFAAAVWTHGSWHLRSFPALRLPAGATVTDPHLVALGRASVWVDFALSKGRGLYPGAVLLHYNGSGWSRVTVPFRSTFMLANLAPDGAGGIWIAATQADGATQFMYDLRGGHWSRMEMPSVKGDTSQVLTVALRPGTTSVWAAGDMVPVHGGVPQGVLLQDRG
jgi:hypothetical protein